MASITKFPYTCFSCRLRLNKSFSRRSFASLSSSVSEDTVNRPSIAPKPSIDIKHVRQNPERYKKTCLDRNYKGLATNPEEIIQLSQQLNALRQGAKVARQRNKELRRELEAIATTRGPETDQGQDAGLTRDQLLAEAKELKHSLSGIEKDEERLQSQIDELALELPNLTSSETPIGEEPRVLGYINPDLKPLPDKPSKSHVDIGAELQLIDFAAASTTSGWGWYFLTNEAALLEQALIQYALSVALEKGWTIVSPPSIVYSHIASACGFRPRDQNGEQQIYTLEQASSKDKRKPELSLAGTAEIPLAGMKANTAFQPSQLPLKCVGVSRCYRAEAGARGLNTKGLYRVHEFTKVEMFAWTAPESAVEDSATSTSTPTPTPSQTQTVFEEMLTIQRQILTSLNIHCRILEMPSTDLGASATRKIDIEAFFPSRQHTDDGWGEVTSASICTDYQTRRLGTTIRNKDGKMGGWPWTVNGTAAAVPRIVMGILENGWDEERGVVVVPEALRPWMRGMDVIGKKG